jgi:hypothetical protein
MPEANKTKQKNKRIWGLEPSDDFLLAFLQFYVLFKIL